MKRLLRDNLLLPSAFFSFNVGKESMKRMKTRFLLLFLFTVTGLASKAQDYNVVSVEPLPMDMTAREYIKTDEKGRQCAVFRIITQNIAPELREGFHFDCDYASFVVDHTIVGGEILVWVSPGIRTLKIKHEKLGPWDLHLTQFVPKVESLHTYKIVLWGMKRDAPPPVEETVWQYLSFNITPTNAMLEVDGEIWPLSWEGTARKRVKTGTYKYRVMAHYYNSKEGSVRVGDSAVIVSVDLEPIVQQEEVKKPKAKTFITLNASYSNEPLFNYGFTVGSVNRFGWFGSVMTSPGFRGFQVDGRCDASGLIGDGILPLYSGKVIADRHSIIVGGIMRLVEPMYAKLGVGYGIWNVSWETTEGKYYLNKDYSLQGIDVSAGLQFHMGYFVISAEAVSTNFKTMEGKIGFGVAF
jgi:hypothetical protein